MIREHRARCARRSNVGWIVCVVIGIAGLSGFSARSAHAASGPILWIDDAGGNIGTVDVHTGATTVIGDSGIVLTDIAFDPSGNLWGIGFTDLYKLNKTTGAATLVGPTGVDGGNALVFDAAGTLYAAADTTTNLYTVNTSTGAATSIGNTGFASAGDLAFNNGSLFLSDTNGDLVKISLDPTVSATKIGPMGFSDVFGLATGDDGVLYGVAGTDIFSINTSTGAGTLSTDYAGHGLFDANGTAFVKETQSGGSGGGITAVPLPSSAWASLSMLGVLAVVGMAQRRYRSVA